MLSAFFDGLVELISNIFELITGALAALLVLVMVAAIYLAMFVVGGFVLFAVAKWVIFWATS